jgi:hypothetical protein
MQAIASSMVAPTARRGSTQSRWKAVGSICRRTIRRSKASNRHEDSSSSWAISWVILSCNFSRSLPICSSLGHRGFRLLAFLDRFHCYSHPLLQVDFSSLGKLERQHGCQNMKRVAPLGLNVVARKQQADIELPAGSVGLLDRRIDSR